MPPTPRRRRRRDDETTKRRWRRRARRGICCRILDRVDAINLVQKSLKSRLSSRFFSRLKFWGDKKVEFSSGRLPPEDGSVRPQTLSKRVSNDSRHFIFRRQTKNWRHFQVGKISFSWFWPGFWGATSKWTSKSDSGSNFVPDTPLPRFVLINFH